MNTYGQSLHNEISDILLKQEAETMQLTTMANAAMFTLYYAEGAVVTTAAVLQAQKDKQVFTALIKKQAAENNNTCSNLLLSAIESNKYLQQSVTNTAVAAANIQVATAAIIKLAADTGSIYSIINAAGFDTGTQQQAAELYTCMNQTAWQAEVTSKLALDVSILVSEVPGGILRDKANTVNKTMQGFMKAVDDDDDKTAELVLTTERNLSTDTAKQREAAIAYTGISNQLKAAGNAFASVNRELNLGLKAGFADEPQTGLEISFNLLQSPFTEKDKTAFYPVKNYYVFLVKEKSRSTFTGQDAGALLQQFSDRYIHVTDLEAGEQEVHKTYNYLQIPGTDKAAYVLKDTDGEAIAAGVNYVVFLLAVYEETYKKHLNDYDDFLSASGKAFSLMHLLPAANTIQTDDTKAGWPKHIFFSVDESPDLGASVEYRCVILPRSEKQKGNEIDFLFNLQLALQVPASCYTVAVRSGTSWAFSLPVDTNDNFGNELRNGQYYIPVILSVFTGGNENIHSYASNWTGYNNSPMLYIN